MKNRIKTIPFGLAMWFVLAMLASLGVGGVAMRLLFATTEDSSISRGLLISVVMVVGMYVCIFWGLVHNRMQLLETRAALEEAISLLTKPQDRAQLLETRATLKEVVRRLESLQEERRNDSK